MKVIFLILISGSNIMMCNPILEYPYGATMLCKDGGKDCHTYTLANGMRVEYSSAHLHYYDGRGTNFVYCSLVNPTGDTLSINRDEFVIKSAKGIAYVSEPYRAEKDPKAMFKKIMVYPSVFPVEGGGKTVYVFAYKTDKEYPKKEMIDLFKTDTIYYLHRTDASTDTLFSLVSDDHRLSGTRK
jgi:hypothetical protein